MRGVERAGQSGSPSDHVKTRKSVKNQTVYANDPDIRWRIATAALEMNAVGPQIRELARDGGGRRGPRPHLDAAALSRQERRFRSLPARAVMQAVRTRAGVRPTSTARSSRLYRDVVAGLFQPSDRC